MKGTNKLLAEQVLSSKFNLMLTIVNAYGEEKSHSLKMKKKDFLLQVSNLDLKVKLVENYPAGILEENWLYISKNGKSAWLKEREE